MGSNPLFITLLDSIKFA